MKFIVVVYSDVKNQPSVNGTKPNGPHYVFKEWVDLPNAQKSTLEDGLKGVMLNKLTAATEADYQLVSCQYYGSSWAVSTLVANVKIFPMNYQCFVMNAF